MVPLAESISKRYPELRTITGGVDLVSRETLTVVFCASAGVESPVRIAAPPRGKHEVAAVEATLERNRLRENPLESGGVRLFPVGTIFIVLVDALRCQGLSKSRPVDRVTTRMPEQGIQTPSPDSVGDLRNLSFGTSNARPIVPATLVQNRSSLLHGQSLCFVEKNRNWIAF
jgi:hypothetical protein